MLGVRFANPAHTQVALCGYATLLPLSIVVYHMQRRRHARRLSQLFGASIRLVVVSLEALAFWAAVAFPLFYLGGYVATHTLAGLSMPSVWTLGGLLGVNLFALVVGHQYDGRIGRTAMDAVVRLPNQVNRSE